MTEIKCLTPNGLEITIPFAAIEQVGLDQWLEDVLELDRVLVRAGFKPLPLPKSGGGNWGNKPQSTRHWIECVDNVLHVYIAYTESKERTAEIKKEWASKIKEATGLGYDVDSETWKDEKGRAQWTFTYPIKVGRELLAVLPESEFERKPTLKARLDAAAKK